jgi:Uma2 family endonuclease
MTVERARRITFADIDDRDDLPERYEVMRGELLESLPSGWAASIAQSRLLGAIGIWLTEHPIGEAGIGGPCCVLERDPLTVLVPSGVFVSNARLEQVHDHDQMFDFAPELIVDVLAPSECADQLPDKAVRYLDGGAQFVWVVDAHQKAVMGFDCEDRSTIRILRVGDVLDGGRVLPSFTLPLADIFL